MLDERLRTYKDKLLLPLAAYLTSFPPNAITLVAAFVGLAAAGAAAYSLYWLALALWLVNRLLDGLDGMVARASDRQSDFGGYLDIVLDFVVYAAVPIGLYLGMSSTFAATSLIVLLASFYVNGASWIYLSAILEKRRGGTVTRDGLTTVNMPAGLIGGTETILFYTLFLLWPSQLPWLFLTMAALVMLGIFQRLVWARSHLLETKAPSAVKKANKHYTPRSISGEPPPEAITSPTQRHL